MNNGILIILAFTACGGTVCLIFDIMRSLRKALQAKSAVTHISDFIFWTAAGVVCTYCLWNFNNGELRMFECLSFAVGMILYFFLLSPLFFKLLTLFFENIFKFTRFILKILLTPLAFLYKIMVVPIKCTILKILRKHKNNGKIKE